MGGSVNKVPANNGTRISDKFYAEKYEGYEVDEHEVGLYHVAQETRNFNTSTGEKLSKSIVQKYDIENFNRMKDGGGFNGMVVHILHNPKGITKSIADPNVGNNGQTSIGDDQKNKAAKEAEKGAK